MLSVFSSLAEGSVGCDVAPAVVGATADGVATGVAGLGISAAATRAAGRWPAPRRGPSALVKIFAGPVAFPERATTIGFGAAAAAAFRTSALW